MRILIFFCIFARFFHAHTQAYSAHVHNNVNHTRMKNLRYIFAIMLSFAASITTFSQINPGDILNDIQNPENWYYINMTAKNSTTSGGTGQVQLMTISMDSSRIYDTFMGMEIPEEFQPAAWPNGNPQGFASELTQLGFSVIFMPGVEADVMGIALSSYGYFAGWAKADDGSYFDGWSYTDGGTDLGMGGAESSWGKEDWTEEQWYDYCAAHGLHSSGDHWVPTGPNDGYWEYDRIYKDDKLTEADNFARFRVLPDPVAGYTLVDGHIVGETNQIVYATFRPVLVGEYTTTLGTIDATAGATGTCQVEVAVSGRNIDSNDFNTPTILGANWSVNSWNYDDSRQKLLITVQYTAPSTIVAGQEYKTTLTVSSKGGSEVSIPLTMRSVASNRTEVTLTIGTTETQTDWATALTMIGSASTEPIKLVLNQNISANVTLSKAMTLDLNGYTLTGDITTTNDILVQYNKYGGAVHGTVSVNSGTLTLEGGTFDAIQVANGGTLVQNGAVLQATLVNAGTTTITNGTMSSTTYAVRSTGVLNIQGGNYQAPQAVYIESGSAHLQKGTFIGGTYAVLSKGNTTIEKLAELSSTTGTALMVQGGTTTIQCGKFDAPTPLARTAGTLNLVSGFFKTESIGIPVPSNLKQWTVSAGPEAEAGYTIFYGEQTTAQNAGVSICTIGKTAYTSLEDALAYANNNPGQSVVIVMRNDYTLPAGNYTLPGNAMLLIPYEAAQQTEYELITRIAKNSANHVDYIMPFEFRRLTMAEGAHLDVFGKIEVSGRQFASDEAYASVPYAGYGLLHMDEGSSMTLQDGSLLRVWGYVTGRGETDVRRGATVFEQFQMGDWKGGTTSMNMLSDWRHVFPLTQYYIQSIESPVKYHPGSVLSSATAVSAALGNIPIVATANDIKIIGIQDRDNAMFLMDPAADEDNTWVRKWYDSERDIQTYEVNSGAYIGSMVLDLGNIAGTNLQMNSGFFNLPITNNMKIHLLSGYMAFTQNTELLPGAEVEVDKESTVSILYMDEIVSGSLYLYDADDWDNYAYDGSGNTKTKRVKYSPSWGGQPTVRDVNTVTDATINVHGTFDTYDGYVFCSEHGANIISSNEDAGTFTFSGPAPTDDNTEEVYQVKGRSNYESRIFSAAKLKNADGQTPAFAETANTEEGKSYCYMNGRWTLMEVDEDDDRFMVDNYGDYYAKPNAYVAVSATKENIGTVYDPWYQFVGNTDHTYSGKYEQDRLFILVGNQWWEVSVRDNLYYCADNDMYYEWDNDGDDWVEKKFTITWKNWNGDSITTYKVPYGTMAEYRSTNPTREANVDYTYDFTGWTPELGIVNSDVTYTATYSAKQRKYTIIFQTEGGVEIERQFLVRDEFPICENEPVKTGHILRWSPAIAAVTGDAVYTATWLEEKPSKYLITFVNYDGSTIKSDSVVAGQMPTAPATPTKDATSEYSYVFNGWKPALENAQRDLTYTAQFKEQQKTYAIRFEDENGNLLGSVQNLHYGDAPVVPNYTKAATAQYTYTITWTPQVSAVSKDQTYRAVVTSTTNRYTVTCQGEGCVFTGAGVYAYGATPTITVSADEKYENATWINGPAANFTVTEDVVFTASATLKDSEEPVYESITLSSNATLDKGGAFEQIMNLTLTSDGIHSADLRGAENLTIMGKANYELIQSMAAQTWYAIAVPWQVSTTNGIQTLGGKTLRIGTDITIVYYDGAIRATQGKVDACWHYVADGEVLVPGQLYMLRLNSSKNGLRMQKKANTELVYSGTLAVYTHPQTTGDTKDANWNGIANPATYHASLSTGATDGQFYNGTGYDLISLSSKEFIVGQPVFVQVPAPQPVVVTPASQTLSPARIAATGTTRHDIQIAAAGGEMDDHIFIATEEDKADEYVIVKDLVKMGTSTQKAQIWVNRYEARLCVNTIAPDLNGATFPLTISVPTNGVYTINVNETLRYETRQDRYNNENVYLMKGGKVIANLSKGGCSLQLTAGETDEYAIRIVPQAPMVPTDVNTPIVNSDMAHKILKDGVIYIVRGEETYHVQGWKIK